MDDQIRNNLAEHLGSEGDPDYQAADEVIEIINAPIIPPPIDMEAIKTFNDHEKDAYNFAIDDTKYDIKQKLTRAKFEQIVAENPQDFRGVIYDFRVEFLKTNRYPITRENLINPDLPSRLDKVSP